MSLEGTRYPVIGGPYDGAVEQLRLKGVPVTFTFHASPPGSNMKHKYTFDNEREVWVYTKAINAGDET
ncbi:MAG: hypothetical protein ABGZ17_07670 [Planctomycetaceae bacterium]